MCVLFAVCRKSLTKLLTLVILVERATGLNLALDTLEESVEGYIFRTGGRTLATHLHVLFHDGKAHSGSKKLASGSVYTLYTLLFGSGR
jgi:hypothetical protein